MTFNCVAECAKLAQVFAEMRIRGMMMNEAEMLLYHKICDMLRLQVTAHYINLDDAIREHERKQQHPECQ